jgi:hypothetical protein
MSAACPVSGHLGSAACPDLLVEGIGFDVVQAACPLHGFRGMGPCFRRTTDEDAADEDTAASSAHLHIMH